METAAMTMAESPRAAEPETASPASPASSTSSASAETAPPKRPRGRPRNDGAPAGSRPSSSAAQARAAGGSSQEDKLARRVAAVKDELTAGFVQLGAATMMVLPTTGCVFALRAAAVSDAIGRIAAKDIRVLRALEKAVQVTAYAEVFGFGLALTVAVGVDRGLVPVQSFPAQTFVGEEIAEVERMQKQMREAMATMQQQQQERERRAA